MLIITIIASILSSVQGFQATQLRAQTSQLAPPPPTKPYWTYQATNVVLAVSVSEDGATVVAGFGDGKINVYGRQSNATIWTYNTANVVESVAVSADGNTIVGGGDDYGIHVFGRQSNKTIWNFITPGFYIVRSVSVSADGDTIAAGAQDSYLRVFGRNTNTTLWYYKTTGIVWGVTVSRDGTTVAAGGSDGFLKVFAHASNATLLNFNTGGFITNVVAMSSDGSTISCGNQMLVGSRASLFSKTLDYCGTTLFLTPLPPLMGQMLRFPAMELSLPLAALMESSTFFSMTGLLQC